MRNRTKQINVRLSQAEYDMLIQNARKVKHTASGYIRALVGGNSPKACPPLEYHELINTLHSTQCQLKSIFHLIWLSKKCDGVDIKLLEKEVDTYREIVTQIQNAVLLPEVIH